MPRKKLKTYMRAHPKMGCPECHGEGWKRSLRRGSMGQEIEVVIRCECVKFVSTPVGNQQFFRKTKPVRHDGKAAGAGE